MTRCTCCGEPVWVMYTPVICEPCLKAGCDPKFEGDHYDTEFGEVFSVTAQTPCKKGSHEHVHPTGESRPDQEAR